MSNRKDIADCSVGFDREKFFLRLISELTGSLETVVGLEEASGFISIVGQYLGEWMDDEYKQRLSEKELSDFGLAQILVDLKRRIGGDFYLVEEGKDKLVLGNRACPFGEHVQGRSSLCMLTSNVFGTITAEHIGYAKVCMHQTIAKGDKECKVVIYKNINTATERDQGREYFKAQ